MGKTRQAEIYRLDHQIRALTKQRNKLRIEEYSQYWTQKMRERHNRMEGQSTLGGSNDG